MALEEIKQPYEVLFRLDETGQVAGKHIGLLSTITKDGAIVGRSQIPVMSFEEAEDHGFDVPALAEFFNTALWSENNALTAQLVQLLAINEALRQELEALRQAQNEQQHQNQMI